jgi:uncharacterized RDD family membrane protein YckC
VHPFVTGEAVALDLRPAALPSRVVAGLVDAVLQLALLLAVGGLVEAVGADVSEAAGSAIGLVVFVLLTIGYPVAFEALLRGRTPGKAAVGLRVVRDDGGPIGFRHAFVRALAGAFLERPGITFFVAGLVTMLLNDRSKRIGDLLAGTVVLQERVAVRGGTVAAMPPPLAAWAAQTDLSGLSDELALSARQFLARSPQLTDQAREDLGGRLLHAVLATVAPPPPADAPGWAVLSAVLAERRRREETRLSSAVPAGPTWGPAETPQPQPHVAAPRPSAPVVPADRPPAPGPGGFVAPS